MSALEYITYLERLWLRKIFFHIAIECCYLAGHHEESELHIKLCFKENDK